MHKSGKTSANEPTDPPAVPYSPVDDAKMRARWRPLIFSLVIVALVMRLIAAGLVERHVQQQGRTFLIEGDANGYWELGQKIAAGQDYSLHQPPRRILRTPGFPLWLAAGIRLFGPNILAARCTLAVAGTVSCWLVFELGRRIQMRRTGFWAALLMAVHPLQIVSSVMILSEALFTAFMLASLLLLHSVLTNGWQDLSDPAVKNVRHRDWPIAGLTGILIGATILIRPGFLLWLFVALGAVLVLNRQSAGRGMLLASVLLLGCSVTLFPWAARNARVSGHWVLTSLWSGPSLYDGLNPAADGSSDMRFFDRERVMQQQDLSEFDMNRHYRDRAVRFALENPGQTAMLALKKAALFLNPVPRSLSQSSWAIRAGCGFFWAALFGFAAIGLWSKQWDAPDLLVMVGPFLLFLLVHMAFVGSVRYRLPVEFPLSVLAAIGWRYAVLTRKAPITG